MTGLVLAIPSSVLTVNDTAEYFHAVEHARRYSEIILPMPNPGSTATVDRDRLAVLTQFAEILDQPCWVSVAWPDLTKYTFSLTGDSFRSTVLFAFNNTITALYNRFNSMNRLDLIKGFYIPHVNWTTVFQGTNGSLASVDRLFQNALIQAVHTLGLPVAVDSEHPSEFFTLVTPPFDRSVQYEGHVLPPTLLGSDSGLVDTVLLKNLLYSYDYTLGITPTGTLRTNGCRFLEAHALARGYSATNLRFVPLQELAMGQAAADLRGGVRLSPYMANRLSGLRSFFEACGYTSFGIVAQDREAMARVLPIDSLQTNSAVVPNTTGTLSQVSAIDSVWNVEFIDGDGKRVFQQFTSDGVPL